MSSYSSLAILFFFVFSSCKSRTEDSSPKTIASKWRAQLLEDVTSGQLAPVFTLSAETHDGKGGELVSYIDRSGCMDPAKQRWVLPVNGFHKELSIEILFNASSDTQKFEVLADGRRFNLTSVQKFPADMLAQFCEQIRLQDHVELSAATSPALQQVFTDWLAGILPECQAVHATEGGWECDLPQVVADEALKDLEELRRAMIRRWSRQPYVLARRTSVAAMLGRALAAEDNGESFNRYCRILETSLNDELPLIMQSTRWRQSVCGGEKLAMIRPLASYGLRKSMDELLLMRDLYEKVSKIGTISFRIPGGDIPSLGESKQPVSLRVVMTPAEDVSQHLGTAIRNLLQARVTRLSVSSPYPTTEQAACWHPLFGEQDGLLELASFLDLTGHASGVDCQVQASVNDQGLINSTHYLAQILSSETEFIVENGQLKVLRLPVGSYSYQITPLPPDVYETDASEVASAATTSGQVAWDQPRPFISIRSW